MTTNPETTIKAAPRTCEVPGCERSHRARGKCATHWARWSQHGDPGEAAIGRYIRRPRPDAEVAR